MVQNSPPALKAASVLFLDVDDVLVVPSLYKIKSRRRVRDGRKVHYAFLPSARTCLLSVLSACPDTALVISSTWRLEGIVEFSTIFRLNGCGELLQRLHEDWRTCEEAPAASRADEIAEWLSRHPEVIHAAAIDNDPSIVGRPWAVPVDPEVGFSEELAVAATALLRPDVRS
jgi:hypothetical protein